MENPIKKFKEEQKSLAEYIKSERKEGVRCEYESYIFRHNHIAYCEIRGRKRVDIEVPREGNEPDESRIDSTKKMWLSRIQEWRDSQNETLCDCN